MTKPFSIQGCESTRFFDITIIIIIIITTIIIIVISIIIIIMIIIITQDQGAIVAWWGARLSALLLRGNVLALRAIAPRPVAEPVALGLQGFGPSPYAVPSGDSVYELLVR